MRKGIKRIDFNNYKFIDSALTNDDTYFDYLQRLKKIALSIFEWVNLPPSMNARFLEMCLYYFGKASFLYSKDKGGYINTKCIGDGYVNIYNLPTKLHCFSVGGFQEMRNLYTGITENIDSENEKDAILVLNNWEGIPTSTTLELFCLRLYELERAIDVNIKGQKYPVIVSGTQKQKLTLENLYNQYNGNQPFIFGEKGTLDSDTLKVLNTNSPVVFDKLQMQKEKIWNEALQFLGVNSVMFEKKERLNTSEAESNNEVINLNLQSYLIPRMEACKQFNEMFGLTGTDKEISVRVRSDLENIIKKEMSAIKDYEVIDDNGNNTDNI